MQNNNRIRISILIYSLGGGGAERVVSVLLDKLSNKFDVLLVLMNETIKYDISKDVKIYYLEKSNIEENGILKLLKLPFLGWKYKNICKEYNIDVSLAFMNRPSYISVFAKLFGNYIKTIISERSTPSQIYCDNSLQSRISKFLIRNLYPYSDKIIANSNGNKQDLIKNFNIKQNKIVTIYNPIDIENIIKKAQEEVNNVDFNKFTFISVGRLDDGKNHKLLIEAFKKINLPNAQLIILGDGPLMNNLQNLINNYKITDDVKLLGFDNNPYKYMSKADCFIFGSNYEGFPNVIAEALVCKLPIISTNCKSGPNEILNNGEYGILTKVGDIMNMADAMKKIFIDTNMRNKFKKSSLERAREFSLNKIVEDFKLNLVGD